MMSLENAKKHLYEALDEVLSGNCKKFVSQHIEKALLEIQKAEKETLEEPRTIPSDKVTTSK